MQVESESEVAQSCPTLIDPMDCSPPGSSIHGIFQARVLEWGAIDFYAYIYKFFFILIMLGQDLLGRVCKNQCILALVLPGVYLKELKARTRTDICAPVFRVMLVIVARRWKQSKYPSTNKCINKMQYVLQYSSARKRNIILCMC